MTIIDYLWFYDTSIQLYYIYKLVNTRVRQKSERERETYMRLKHVRARMKAGTPWKLEYSSAWRNVRLPNPELMTIKGVSGRAIPSGWPEPWACEKHKDLSVQPFRWFISACCSSFMCHHVPWSSMMFRFASLQRFKTFLPKIGIATTFESRRQLVPGHYHLGGHLASVSQQNSGRISVRSAVLWQNF